MTSRSDGKMIVGCDNGAGGGWAAISTCGPIIDLLPMPVDAQTRYIDVLAIMHWLKTITHGDLARAEIWIEKPIGAKSYNAAKSMWSCFHSIRGAICSHGHKLHEVTPRRWQACLMGADKQKQSKDQESALAGQIWPKYNWPTLRPTGKKLHDGIIDAALIAYWASGLWENTENTENNTQ
jgi:hypothetical protein